MLHSLRSALDLPNQVLEVVGIRDEIEFRGIDRQQRRFVVVKEKIAKGRRHPLEVAEADMLFEVAISRSRDFACAAGPRAPRRSPGYKPPGPASPSARRAAGRRCRIASSRRARG